MDLIVDWFSGRTVEVRKFIVLLIIALCASVLAIFSIKVAAIFALICVHIFWGYYSSTQEPGFITLAFVYGIIAFIILTWWIPGVEKFGSASLKATRAFVKNEAEKAEVLACEYEEKILGTPCKLRKASVTPVTPTTQARSIPTPVTTVPQARAVQPTEGFVIDLDERWSEGIAIPPGKSYNFWCSSKGAEVILTYSGGTSSYPSGVPFKCPTADDNTPVGSNLRNPRFKFRSFVPDVTATVTY